MTRKQRILQNFLVGLFGITAFLTIATFSLLWVNGLSYDRATGSFERTAVIAIEPKLKDVTVLLNGLEVATSLPHQERNLEPGYYEVEILRGGYYSYQKNFRLRDGQVGIIEEVALIAESPLITDLPVDYRFIEIGSISTGLSLNSGELYDGTKFITRFARQPEKIYRLNHLYLYQLGDEVRVYVAETAQDFLLFVSGSPITAINPKPFSWSFAVANSAGNFLVNIVETSEAAADSLL